MSDGQRQLKGAIRLESTQNRWFSLREGRKATRREQWPKDNQNYANFKGTNRLESTQVRCFSWQSVRETEPREQWLKTLKSIRNESGQPRDILKNRQSDSPKRELTLCQGMLKRGDDVNDVDDEVRAIVPSQNHATATLH